jgi:hypothetical protein
MSIAGATVREILAKGIDLICLNWHYRPSLNGRIPVFSDVGA